MSYAEINMMFPSKSMSSEQKDSSNRISHTLSLQFPLTTSAVAHRRDGHLSPLFSQRRSLGTPRTLRRKSTRFVVTIALSCVLLGTPLTGENGHEAGGMITLATKTRPMFSCIGHEVWQQWTVQQCGQRSYRLPSKGGNVFIVWIVDEEELRENANRLPTTVRRWGR